MTILNTAARETILPALHSVLFKKNSCSYPLSTPLSLLFFIFVLFKRVPSGLNALEKLLSSEWCEEFSKFPFVTHFMSVSLRKSRSRFDFLV